MTQQAAMRPSTRGMVSIAVASLALAALTAVTAGPADAQEAPDECAGQGIPASQVGFQLFTAREALGDRGYDDVLGELAGYGFEEIQPYAGTYNVPSDELKAIMDSHGLKASSGQHRYNDDNFADYVAYAQAIGQHYLGSGGFGQPGVSTLEDTLATAEQMNRLGQVSVDAGLGKLFGHNHDGEFTTMHDYDLDGDGEVEPTPAIEILMAETDPQYVALELDVYWARIGLAGGRGADDLAENLLDQQAVRDFGAKWADRIELLHVKDVDEAGDFANVGEGTTDWAAFFETVPNVEYYVIEHDSPDDAMVSAQVGFDYLTCELYGAGDQTISVTVPEQVDPGEFLWTIQGDGSVDLGEMADEGAYLRATGPIDPISVTDTRTDGPEWSISGQVSDFDPGGLAGEHLGWTPMVIEDGAGAVAGDPVASGIDGGDGLAVPSTLASAPSGHEAGTGLVGAELDLRFPAATDPGDYSATVTITALS